MKEKLRILHRDEGWVAIEKPPGHHVHAPEDPTISIPKFRNCLKILRNQLDQLVYPIHRLDTATSGVVLFALSPETASDLNRLFRERAIRKTYFAITRGWMEDRGTIDHPLEGAECITHFETLAKIDLPHAVDRYPTSRYSLVKIFPVTGRRHQIRRHFAHLSHPLIGDRVYGNGKHNRFFNTELEIRGLLLKAYSLEFTHPTTGNPLQIRSNWGKTWHQVFDQFGICPL